MPKSPAKRRRPGSILFQTLEQAVEGGLPFFRRVVGAGLDFTPYPFHEFMANIGIVGVGCLFGRSRAFHRAAAKTQPAPPGLRAANRALQTIRTVFVH